MTENLFLNISVLFGITVSVAFVMRLLRQPLVVAYIVAGLIAGPLFLHKIPGLENSFASFSQFGIVLLLFIVGLSLNFEYIKRVGKDVLIGGTAQFLVTAAAGMLVMKGFGYGLLPALFVSVAITFSSTIIVVKLLVDKKDLETAYGQYVVGLLLVQDIIAVLMLIVLNMSHDLADWQHAVSLLVGKAALLGIFVYVLSKKVLPRIMHQVAVSSEMLFIFTIAWCFGVASLVYTLGFGVEMGAVIAGLSLGSSPYQPEISSRLRPLRDFFIVLFFIVLGSELQLGDIPQVLGPGVLISLFVLVVQPMILYTVMRRLGYRRRSSFLAGVTSAQVSEFGFILVFKGQELGILHGQELALLTFIALTTIFVSSYLITYNNQLYHWARPLLDFFGKETGEDVGPKKPEVHVWVIGYHRVGWKVCEALRERKIKFAVIDSNPQAIKKMAERGIVGYFGDIADVEFLETLPLEKAETIICTAPDPDDQKTLFRFVRRHSHKTFLIGSLHHSRDMAGLYEAGADYVLLAHLLVGVWVTELLDEKKWNKHLFSQLRSEQKQELKIGKHV